MAGTTTHARKTPYSKMGRYRHSRDLKNLFLKLLFDRYGDRLPISLAIRIVSIGSDVASARERLSRREAEILRSDRALTSYLNLVERSASSAEFVKLLKSGYRAKSRRFFLLRILAASLRKQKRSHSVQRLANKAKLSFDKGRLSVSDFIQILRYLDRRGSLTEYEKLVRIADRKARANYIESLIELLNYDRANTLANQWLTSLEELSKKHKKYIEYFRARQSEERLIGILALQDRILSDLNRRPSGPTKSPTSHRVLIVASSLSIGGAERQLSLLATHLGGLQGHEVTVFVGEQRSAEYDIKSHNNIAVIYRDEVNRRLACCARGMPRKIARDLEVFFQRSTVDPLFRVIRKVKPDTVYHAVGLPTDTILASTYAGVEKIIVRLGGLTFYNDFSHADRQEVGFNIAERCCRFFGNRIRFICNSHAGALAWGHRFSLSPSALTVIHNGIAMPQTEPTVESQLRASLFGDPDVHVMGFVGRFHPVKRVDLWCAAAFRIAARQPSVRFLLVGDGPLRSAMMQRVEQSGFSDRFRFAGLVLTDLDRYYRAMDVLLSTSLTESFPNVVLEALSQGAYVVAPKVGEIPSIIDDELSGRCYEDDHPESIAALVEDAFQERLHGAAREYRAQKTFATFGVASMLGRYLDELR
jgi:glycosyltransferase involved in cell wall biosynthesis